MINRRTAIHNYSIVSLLKLGYKVIFKKRIDNFSLILLTLAHIQTETYNLEDPMLYRKFFKALKTRATQYVNFLYVYSYFALMAIADGQTRPGLATLLLRTCFSVIFNIIL